LHGVKKATFGVEKVREMVEHIIIFSSNWMHMVETIIFLCSTSKTPYALHRV